MTRKQAAEQFIAGSRVILAEYRGSKLEHVEWRDKESGKAMKGDFLKHNIESGPDPIVVNERLAEGTDAKATLDERQKTLKKGQTVLVTFSQMSSNKGQLSMTGKLEPITD